MSVRLSEWKQTEVNAIRVVGEKLDQATTELSGIPDAICKAAEDIVATFNDENGCIGRLSDALKELSATSTQLRLTCFHLRYSMRTSLLSSLIAREDIRICLMVLHWLEAIVADERLSAEDVDLKLRSFGASSLALAAKDYVKSAGLLPNFALLLASVDSGTTDEWRHKRLHEIDDFHLEILVLGSSSAGVSRKRRTKSQPEE
jgi:hypothetical protein